MTNGKIKISYIIEVIVLAIIITIVVFVLQGRNGNTPDVTENQNINTNSPTGSVTNGAVTQKPDADGDGLSDEEEAALATNASLADTDGDGLTDYDETKVYKSDPKDADSDDDGNTDGKEVANGYSPTDGTKLLDLEREKQKFNQ